MLQVVTIGVFVLAFLYMIGTVLLRERQQRWRALGRETKRFAVFYGVTVVVFMFLENYFLYSPIKHGTGWVHPGRLQVEDIWLSAAPNQRVHAWWCPVPPEQEQFVVLYCHGNAGNLSHRHELIRMWQLHLGASVLIFDYPGFGRSEGKPTEAGCYAAVYAAYDWLRLEKGVPDERLVLFGKSLGGAMAVEVAMHKPHAALVLHSTFTCIPDMAQTLFPFLPARWLVRSRYDNLSKLKNYQGRLFVAHGQGDNLIPYGQGQRLFEAATANPKHFYRIPADGHAIVEHRFFQEVKQFLHNGS
jgi:fermentation-respiration switch protein FrsA (DUF1100 family)